jgi:hypothetical protein
MCFSAMQMWRVYQRGLERWIADLLQPVFDNLVTDGLVPRYVQVGLAISLNAFQRSSQGRRQELFAPAPRLLPAQSTKEV